MQSPRNEKNVLLVQGIGARSGEHHWGVWHQGSEALLSGPDLVFETVGPEVGGRAPESKFRTL